MRVVFVVVNGETPNQTDYSIWSRYILFYLKFSINDVTLWINMESNSIGDAREQVIETEDKEMKRAIEWEREWISGKQPVSSRYGGK